MKKCPEHPSARIATLKTGEEACMRCLSEEYEKYGDMFVNPNGQRDFFEERLIDGVLSGLFKKTLHPCPKCGEPFSMFDPKEFHIDPPMCKECWAKEKPSLIKRIIDALVHVKERRTKFSNASPGVGKRKGDV